MARAFSPDNSTPGVVTNKLKSEAVFVQPLEDFHSFFKGCGI